MSIRVAIEQLEAEIAELDQGGKSQPAEGSVEWFRLRALATGLSLLRTMERKKVDASGRMAERFYRNALKAMKIEQPEEQV